MKTLGVPVMCVILALASPLLAAENASDVRDQGVHYYKKGLFKPALTELTRAAELSGGRPDVVTALYLSKTHRELRRIDLSFRWARTAAKWARQTQEMVPVAEANLSQLRADFGEFRVVAPTGSTEMNLDLRAATRFINRKKNAQFLSLREQLRAAPTQLPKTLYLPHGDYTINGTPLRLKPTGGGPVEVLIAESKDDSGADLTWLYVSSGVLAAGVAIGSWFLLKPDDRSTSDEFRHVILIRDGR